MVRFVPVDHDPFGAPTRAPALPAPPSMLGPNARYVQVDHDPFADMDEGFGGLAPDASPIDYATQSMTAARAQLPAPSTPEGRFAELRADANQQMVQPAQPQEPRFGDSLKPAFGGHNPIAEVFDRVVQPFLPQAVGGAPDAGNAAEQQFLGNRGLGERAADTAAFAASLPVRMATRGEYGAGDVATGLGFPEAGESLSAGEQDFAQANRKQLEALALTGEAALGGFGASVAPMAPRNLPRPVVEGAPPMPRRAPPQRIEPTFGEAPGMPPPAANVQSGVPAFGQPGAPVGPSPQAMSMPASNTARARQYVRDLDELGMPRFGPAIAQAAREGEGMGVLTRMVQNVPLAGRPIERGGIEFYNAGARVADDLAGQYSRTGNPERAGQAARDYFDRFKNEHSIDPDDLAAMPDDQVRTLARTLPRDLGSLKSATSARYEAAWRNIPEERRLGKSFEGEPRLMGDMPQTRDVLMDIYGDNVRMMNEKRLSRMKVADETPDALPTNRDALHKAAIPFRGGILGRAIEDILGGSWKGSLQTMRNIRSTVRRSNAKIADNEGNVLSKGQLQRLYGAISRDMDNLMVRVAREFREVGTPQAIADAQRFEAARHEMRIADRFTRRHAEAMEQIKSITGAQRDMQVIDVIRNAAQKGSKANSDILLQVRRLAPNDILDAIASGVLNNMGAPTGRAGASAQEAGFSLGKAVSQWDSMSPRGRQLIWGHRPQLYQQLNKFFDVARGMAEYEKMVNTSKSGQHVISALASAGILGTALTSIAGFTNAMLVGAGAYGAARFLTSPAYVAWLTKSLQIQKAARQGKMAPPAANAAAQRHANALVRLIRSDKTLSPEESVDLLRTIGASGEPPQDGNQPDNGYRQ